MIFLISDVSEEQGATQNVWSAWPLAGFKEPYLGRLRRFGGLFVGDVRDSNPRK